MPTYVWVLWASSLPPRVKAAASVAFFPFRLYVKRVMQTKVHELGVSGDSVVGVEDSKLFLFHQVLRRQNGKANSADGQRTAPTTPWSSCRHRKGPCKEDALQCWKSVLEQWDCLRFFGHWGLQAPYSYFAKHVCICRGKTLLMTRLRRQMLYNLFHLGLHFSRTCSYYKLSVSINSTLLPKKPRTCCLQQGRCTFLCRLQQLFCTVTEKFWHLQLSFSRLLTEI